MRGRVDLDDDDDTTDDDGGASVISQRTYRRIRARRYGDDATATTWDDGDEGWQGGVDG